MQALDKRQTQNKITRSQLNLLPTNPTRPAATNPAALSSRNTLTTFRVGFQISKFVDPSWRLSLFIDGNVKPNQNITQWIIFIDKTAGIFDQ